jgi:hypothetical protein
MSRSAPEPEIPAEPHLTIVIGYDASCTIDGEPVSAHDGRGVRRAAIERAAATARTLGRPVRVTATEPGATYRLIVHQGATTETAPPPPAPPSPAGHGLPWRRARAKANQAR